MLTKSDLIAFEHNLANMWELGKIKCPLHLSGGNEEELIQIFKEIKHGDYIFSGHRNHYHALLSGVPCEYITNSILQHKNSMAISYRPCNFFSSAIVGGMCAIAVGTALGLKSTNSHVWCFVGDGVLDGGHFWEAIEYANGWELPITFVVEDNNRSTCTTVPQRLGVARKYMNNVERLRWYTYTPKYPHCGTGTYVQF